MTLNMKLLAAGTGVYLIGSAAAYSLFKPASGKTDGHGAASFDSLADGYDAAVNFEETFMGLKLLRRWLVSNAMGDVLEISAGTGRNLPYYKWAGLRSLTVTDASKHMLFHAREKHAAKQTDVPVHFLVTDAARICGDGCARDSSDGSSPPSSHEGTATGESSSRKPSTIRLQRGGTDWQSLPEGGFDFVIDTFGLCSHAAPVDVLKEASRACKPDGRILLLEHGRAHYDWLNSILDRDADRHRRAWACQWNLDIQQIVHDSGLEVLSQSRWHFGTTYLIVAKPARVPSRRQ